MIFCPNNIGCCWMQVNWKTASKGERTQTPTGYIIFNTRYKRYVRTIAMLTVGP